MSAFEPVRDLLVGRVIEVSGTTVRIELSGDVDELMRSYLGRVYPIGQLGSVVKIHYGRKIVFGFVTLLRMRTEEDMAAAPVNPAAPEHRVMEVELFAEGLWSGTEQGLEFRRGVSTFPLPRQSVYLLTRDEATILYKAAEGSRPDGADPLVPFATYIGSDAAQCRANIDKMFGLHCAVLGSTGSGKSGAVAALIHSVLAHKPQGQDLCSPRIIILDPHGEYGKAFGERAIVYRAYDPIGTEETEGESIMLPYWLMSAEEFRLLLIGKTEFEATSQNNIVYKALAHARMCHQGLVEPAPVAYGGPAPADGGEPDLARPRAGVDRQLIEGFDRDKPRPFTLQEFENHIRFLQAARVQNGALAPITATDFSKGFRSILDKLDVLKLDPRIRSVMKDRIADGISLEKLLGQLVGNLGAGKDIRIVDMSGLPNEVAGPLAAMLARMLFQYKLYQTSEERRSDPVLLICEEAHRYVPDRGDAEYAAAQTAIRRIAREGRKYGVGLMLVSQRPADIEGTVISQCGTWLVLRLTNSSDQQHVARFLPDSLAGLTRSLPALAQREALFVGEGSAIPARVKIRTLKKEQIPRSDTVSFATGWCTTHRSVEELKVITDRMTKDLVANDADGGRLGDEVAEGLQLPENAAAPAPGAENAAPPARVSRRRSGN